MRRPSFDRWIKREVMRISNARTFNMRRFAAQAQDQNPQLAAPLFLYAYATGTLDKLMGYIYRDDVLATYQKTSVVLSGRNITQLALRKNPPAPLLPAYQDLLIAYKAAYYHPEAEAERKYTQWKAIHTLQLEKGATNAEIYQALHLDAGNVNAFLKHGTPSKLSNKAIEDIQKYLQER